MRAARPAPMIASPRPTGDLTVELRFAYHAEVAPATLDLHTRHPFYTWWWCDRGRARVTLDGRDHLVRPGQWVLFPPNCERRHRIDPGTVLVSISFEAVWSTGMPLLEMPGLLIVDGDGHAAVRRVARDLCRAEQALRSRPGVPASPRPGGVAAFRLRGRLMLFIAELFDRAADLGCTLTTPGSGDERLDWVLKEMRSRLRAGPLPWPEWSRRVGLSRSQLDRLCRQVHGVSLRQRRDQLLLDELRKRLCTGRESIKQVAALLGFVDTAHLCRWTRRHTGRSPREIRREALA